jgi:hypothetical protein
MELGEPKTHETWYKKWTKNIVLLYIGMVFVFMAESVYSDKMKTECTAEGNKELIFVCFVFSWHVLTLSYIVPWQTAPCA